MQTAPTCNQQRQFPPSSEIKSRLFKTACLTQETINKILKDRQQAQSRRAPRHDVKELAGMCFSVEFVRMELNAKLQQTEAIFVLREPDNTFFGYFYESALNLCL